MDLWVTLLKVRNGLSVCRHDHFTKATGPIWTTKTRVSDPCEATHKDNLNRQKEGDSCQLQWKIVCHHPTFDTFNSFFKS